MELRRLRYFLAVGEALNFTKAAAQLRIAQPALRAEPLVALSRKDYSEYHRLLDRLFTAMPGKPRIAVECDGANSLILKVEAGHGIALVTTILKAMSGKRLVAAILAASSDDNHS